MTSLYVAGPMTGYPEWNFPAFAEAARDLRAHGFEVVSPHEIDLEGGFDPSGDGAGFDLRAALERDVEEVLKADGLALLEGWQESSGAVVEVLTAGSAGTPAHPVREWLQAAKGLVVAAAVVGVVAAAVLTPKSAIVEAEEKVEQIIEISGEVLSEDGEPELGRDGKEERREDRREALVL